MLTVMHNGDNVCLPLCLAGLTMHVSDTECRHCMYHMATNVMYYQQLPF